MASHQPDKSSTNKQLEIILIFLKRITIPRLAVF